MIAPELLNRADKCREEYVDICGGNATITGLNAKKQGSITGDHL